MSYLVGFKNFALLPLLPNFSIFFKMKFERRTYLKFFFRNFSSITQLLKIIVKVGKSRRKNSAALPNFQSFFIIFGEFIERLRQNLKMWPLLLLLRRELWQLHGNCGKSFYYKFASLPAIFTNFGWFQDFSENLRFHSIKMYNFQLRRILANFSNIRAVAKFQSFEQNFPRKHFNNDDRVRYRLLHFRGLWIQILRHFSNSKHSKWYITPLQHSPSKQLPKSHLLHVLQPNTCFHQSSKQPYTSHFVNLCDAYFRRISISEPRIEAPSQVDDRDTVQLWNGDRPEIEL